MWNRSRWSSARAVDAAVTERPASWPTSPGTGTARSARRSNSCCSSPSSRPRRSSARLRGVVIRPTLGGGQLALRAGGVLVGKLTCDSASGPGHFEQSPEDQADTDGGEETDDVKGSRQGFAAGEQGQKGDERGCDADPNQGGTSAKQAGGASRTSPQVPVRHATRVGGGPAKPIGAEVGESLPCRKRPGVAAK